MNEQFEAKEVKRLEALALTMPKWDDFVVDEFRKDPEWAKYRIAGELEEYAITGEITYLLATLKHAAIAKGWVQLAKETGLGRTTLFDTLNGKNRPRIDTLTKILAALGFKMLFVAVDNAQPQPTNSVQPQRRAIRKTVSRLPHD